MSASTCLFCRISLGDEPAAVVLQTPEVLGFLDTRPVFKGHVLVIPRTHVVTVVDLPTDLLDPFLAGVQRVAHAMTTARHASSAAASVSATTATIRCPTKRATLSSM